MPTSSATVSTQNMELTPMQVIYKGVDLGGTLGNCTVKVDFTKADIKADQSGETIRDRRTSGLNITIATELTEIANKAVWKTVFPHARLVGTAPTQQLYFFNNIGDSDLANAGLLTLHPLSKAPTDKSGDYNFFLAVADAKSEIVYGPKDQAKLKITWNVLPDNTTTPERFFQYGDPTIGLVNALAGAPSFTGTGNGTLTAVSVVNAYTKTETVTVKCVGASSGNDFYVSGSLSGPIGEFHVAAAAASSVNFSSNQIAFTVTQGSTQFVVNDNFTIATTAANNV